MLKPLRTKPIFAFIFPPPPSNECVAMKRDVLNSQKGNEVHGSIDIDAVLNKLKPKESC